MLVSQCFQLLMHLTRYCDSLVLLFYQWWYNCMLAQAVQTIARYIFTSYLGQCLLHSAEIVPCHGNSFTYFSETSLGVSIVETHSKYLYIKEALQLRAFNFHFIVCFHLHMYNEHFDRYLLFIACDFFCKIFHSLHTPQNAH